MAQYAHVQKDADGEDVLSRIERVPRAEETLWREVRELPFREVRLSIGTLHLRDAEVAELHASCVGEEDILCRYVTMDDRRRTVLIIHVSVSGVQARADVRDDAARDFN